MAIQLRDYQETIIQDTRDAFRDGKRSIVIVSPTGSGKGVILPYISSGLVQNDKNVLIMVHRKRLLRQLAKKLDEMNVCYSVIQGVKRMRYKCMIGLVKTVKNRMAKLPDPDYILTDEGHRALAPEYRAIYDNWPKARKIFLTATPARTDGKGLKEVADFMVLGPDMSDLIQRGFLAAYDYYEPPSDVDYSLCRVGKDGEYNEKDEETAIAKSHIVGDAVKHYFKLLNGRPCIVFCRGINGAKQAAEEFNAAGIPSAHVDGTMSEDDLELIFKEYEDGKLKALMSADLISEGLDLPECAGVIMLRRTQSVIMFLQSVGRCLRLKKDGSRAVIIDHVGNCQNHGYPADPRVWTLDDIKKKKGEVCLKTCDKCSRSFHAHEAKQVASEECFEDECPLASGEQVIRIPKPVGMIDEDLVRADPWEWAGGIDPVLARGSEFDALIAKADSEEKLKQIQRARGYNARWVQHLAIRKGLKKATRSFSKFSVR